MKLKEFVTSSPVLVLPDDDLPFWLKVVSSGITTSAILAQQSCKDNAWHPLAFLSKALNPVEWNHEIHDTKMLAIIMGLEEWRHYLKGAWYPVEIWTNHKNLKYFRVAQKFNWCQARWLLYLLRFNFTLHHKPGQSMGKPMHFWGKLIMAQVKVIMITSPSSPQSYFKSMHSQEQDSKEMSKIYCKRFDVVFTRVYKRNQWRASKGQGTRHSHKHWVVREQGITHVRGRIYVPNNRDLMEQHHDTHVTGPLSRWIRSLMRGRGYWFFHMMTLRAL
jgi:hypothetical protein